MVPVRCNNRARERAGGGRPLLALRIERSAEGLEQWFFKITDYADDLT
jgi:hypothetical protein